MTYDYNIVAYGVSTISL